MSSETHESHADRLEARAAGLEHGIGNSNFFRVSEWLRIAGKKPNGLTMGVQAGVMLEEMVELFRTMTIASSSGAASVILTEASRMIDEVASQLKSGEAFLYFYDREATLDAFCDIDVTVNGTAYLGGFLKEEADTLVINSLFDKFNPDGTPVIKPGGKIGKREGWIAPDISAFVGATAQPSEEDQPFHPYMSAARWVQEFRRQNPDVAIDDGIVNQLVMQAILVGAELERAKTSPSNPVAEFVGNLNAAAEADNNTIAPASDRGA